MAGKKRGTVRWADFEKVWTRCTSLLTKAEEYVYATGHEAIGVRYHPNGRLVRKV